MSKREGNSETLIRRKQLKIGAFGGTFR